MKTLPRATTAQFFDNENDYDALRTYWKEHGHKQASSASHFLLATALLGKDWTKGFTPIGQDPQPKKGESVAYYRQQKDREGNLLPLKEHTVNAKGTRKLEGGMNPNQARINAIYTVKSQYQTNYVLKPFGGLVTPETLEKVRALLSPSGEAYVGVKAPSKVYMTPQPTLQQVQALA